MKFLIVFALITVVSALPPRHGFEHRPLEDYELDSSSFHQNKYRQINLIKSVYQHLIEKLNRPPQDENEEEIRAINDIVNTINMIGEIIHDNSDNGEENDVFNRPPKPQHPEHNVQDGDVPYKPPGTDNKMPPNEQVKIPPINISEDEVIFSVAEVPPGEPSEGEKLSLVDTVKDTENENDDENNHDILSLVSQKDDAENPFIAFNSKSVANEVLDL